MPVGEREQFRVICLFECTSSQLLKQTQDWKTPCPFESAGASKGHPKPVKSDVIKTYGRVTLS